jgi:hypothetical protein
MNCEQARSEMLAGIESSELESHLSTCPACGDEQISARRIRQVLGEQSLWEEPSPELEQRILSIGRAAGNGRSAAGGTRFLIPAAALVAVLVAGTLLWPDRADWEFDLAAVGGGQGASATVAGWNEEQGTRLRIEISGVAQSPPGHYYEIWLTSPAGLHVSAGTFRGDGVIDATVAVRRSDFPRLWITLESVEDGDAGPSSATYFDSA